MNKKLRFTGGEPDITEDNLLRDAQAVYDFAFALGLGMNEGNSFIISGCEFTLNAGVSGEVAAGYVFHEGEVVQVEAQTISETFGSNLFELYKATDYDTNGDKTYNDGTFRRTYQKNRMVLRNVAGISEFDVSNAERFKDLFQCDFDETNTDSPRYIKNPQAEISDVLKYGEFVFGDLGAGGRTGITLSNVVGSHNAEILSSTGPDERLSILFDSPLVGVSIYEAHVELLSNGNWNDDNDVITIIKNKNNSGFEVLLREVGSVQNLNLFFTIRKVV